MVGEGAVKKRAKRAAFLVGLSALIGFYRIAFVPEIYTTPLFVGIVFGLVLLLPVGAFLAFFLGLPTYFFFKKFIKTRLVYIFVLCNVIFAAWPLGHNLSTYIFREMMKSSPIKNQIDTNGDGRIDKWVYDKDLSTIVELDIDFDGKPDVRQYYKNSFMIKQENLAQ